MYAKYTWFKAKGQLACIAPEGPGWLNELGRWI